MAFAISIRAMGATGSALRDLWNRFGEFEPSPSMVALNYPPHVTLAVYDGISGSILCEALRSIFRAHPPIKLRFRRLAFFERPRLVFYAVPDRSTGLLAVHGALHQLVDRWSCREHYLPDIWVPHCTLATQVDAKNSPLAKALADSVIDPFEVIFDVADCVEFHPVRIIEEVPLLART
jgi:2'-5' RNA ligase